MKSAIWALGGIFTGLATLLLISSAESLRRRRAVPVEYAAERLQQAWADHHTRV